MIRPAFTRFLQALVIALATALPGGAIAGETQPGFDEHALSSAALSVDRSAGDYVFPRDGVGVQPAFASRKKLVRLRVEAAGDDSLPAVFTETPSSASPATAGPVCIASTPQARAPHPWRSRAPPAAC